jgi:hypothetical protein
MFKYSRYYNRLPNKFKQLYLDIKDEVAEAKDNTPADTRSQKLAEVNEHWKKQKPIKLPAKLIAELELLSFTVETTPSMRIPVKNLTENFIGMDVKAASTSTHAERVQVRSIAQSPRGNNQFWTVPAPAASLTQEEITILNLADAGHIAPQPKVP